jgi:hypothetical protein
MDSANHLVLSSIVVLKYFLNMGSGMSRGGLLPKSSADSNDKVFVLIVLVLGIILLYCRSLSHACIGVVVKMYRLYRVLDTSASMGILHPNQHPAQEYMFVLEFSYSGPGTFFLTTL